MGCGKGGPACLASSQKNESSHPHPRLRCVFFFYTPVCWISGTAMTGCNPRTSHTPPPKKVPPPLSFPTPGKTVPHHPLGDGCQVILPHPPLGDRTTTVHAHLQAQKLQHKTVLPSRS